MRSSNLTIFRTRDLGVAAGLSIQGMNLLTGSRCAGVFILKDRGDRSKAEMMFLLNRVGKVGPSRFVNTLRDLIAAAAGAYSNPKARGVHV